MEYIQTDRAPQAIGPYAQAVRVGEYVFCSGQIGLDPKTGALVTGGIQAETKQVLLNIEAVLQEASLTLSAVVKIDVYLVRPEHFAEMNAVYADFFKEHTPARATVFVSSLPKNALVEIACVAYSNNS